MGVLDWFTGEGRPSFYFCSAAAAVGQVPLTSLGMRLQAYLDVAVLREV